MIAKERFSDGELWRRVLLIRRFEELLLRMFESGDIVGTTHCCIGQEANAVGVASCLRADDFVVSNHRCHGHYLARTGDVEGLLAEMMGRSAGAVGGRGGSQHLHVENFISNGILGGGTPIAVGTALAHKLEKTGAVTVCFIGDGTFGEGVLYEALNLASLWRLPVLFVVENNRYSQSTPIEKNLAGSLGVKGTIHLRARGPERAQHAKFRTPPNERSLRAAVHQKQPYNEADQTQRRKIQAKSRQQSLGLPAALFGCQHLHCVTQYCLHTFNILYIVIKNRYCTLFLVHERH